MDAPSSAPQPLIVVMPEEFRGPDVPIDQPQKISGGIPPAPIPTPPLVVVVKEKKEIPPKKRRVSRSLLLGLGVIFLAVLLGAWFLLSSLGTPPAETASPTVQSPRTVVVPELQPEKPPVKEQDQIPVAPVEPKPGADRDSDGLSDVEEFLFGSDANNADTDRDSFLDGNEVYHLYDPRRAAPALLTETTFVTHWSEDAWPYALVYPARWSAEVGDKDLFEVVLRSPASEQITVRLGEKDSSGSSLSFSSDERLAFVETEKGVFIFTYDLGNAKTIEYLTTFRMIVNSATF